eukprot:12913-Heterococcus_DN1.PRE.2
MDCEESSDDERLLVRSKSKKKAAARCVLDSSSSDNEGSAALAQPTCDAADADSPVVQRKPRSRKVVLQSDTESSSSSENDQADESDADHVQALTKGLSDLKPFKASAVSKASAPTKREVFEIEDSSSDDEVPHRYKQAPVQRKPLVKQICLSIIQLSYNTNKQLREQTALLQSELQAALDNQCSADKCSSDKCNATQQQQ